MARPWSIKNLYFYLVCLVTLFMFVGGAISAANNLAQIALPDQPNVPLTYLYYPEQEIRETVPQAAPATEPPTEPPTLEELEKRRAEQERLEKHYQDYARRSLLNSVALMAISAPFYLYHWKKVKPTKAKRGITDET